MVMFSSTLCCLEYAHITSMRAYRNENMLPKCGKRAAHNIIRFMNITNIRLQNAISAEETKPVCTLTHIAMRKKKSVGSIPDVLLNLCLGLQIERISRQKSDPLLLSLGSILLLLQQHFGETLCGNPGAFNRADSYGINSNIF